jgi:hypothetical protein
MISSAWCYMKQTQIILNISHYIKLMKYERKIHLKFLCLILFLLNITNINFLSLMNILFCLLGSAFIIISFLLFMRNRPIDNEDTFREKIINQNISCISDTQPITQNENDLTWLKSKAKMYLITFLGFLVIFMIDVDFSKINMRDIVGVIFLSLSIATMVFTSKK